MDSKKMIEAFEKQYGDSARFHDQEWYETKLGAFSIAYQLGMKDQESIDAEIISQLQNESTNYRESVGFMATGSLIDEEQIGLFKSIIIKHFTSIGLPYTKQEMVEIAKVSINAIDAFEKAGNKYSGDEKKRFVETLVEFNENLKPVAPN